VYKGQFSALEIYIVMRSYCI